MVLEEFKSTLTLVSAVTSSEVKCQGDNRKVICGSLSLANSYSMSRTHHYGALLVEFESTMTLVSAVKVI